MSAIEQEARLRHERHVDHPTHRSLSHNYEYVGLRGEQEYAREFGCKVDLSAKPGGDGGRDFGLAAIGYGHVIIDVKTARKRKSLLVEVGKVKPLTIYVLGRLRRRPRQPDADRLGVGLEGAESADRSLQLSHFESPHPCGRTALDGRAAPQAFEAAR